MSSQRVEVDQRALVWLLMDCLSTRMRSEVPYPVPDPARQLLLEGFHNMSPEARSSILSVLAKGARHKGYGGWTYAEILFQWRRLYEELQLLGGMV